MLQAEVSDTDGKKVSKLTDLEIIAQAITFMLAGYETTRSALAFTTYCLALNPDKQEKLLQEIDQNIEDGVRSGCIFDCFCTSLVPGYLWF